jgi:hypothetical protein
MKLRLLASARRDLDEGYAFYESQEPGLGDYFLASVKGDVESLRVSAGIHAIKYRDYHRMLCRVFPFAVFYTRMADGVLIHAVLDCRRDPAWIRQRLQE